jgi:hypothetical protein
MAKGRAVATVLAQRRYALEPEDHGQEDDRAPSTMHRIRWAFGLQPHRVETFRLSSDPFSVEKVRDIVGLCWSTRRKHPSATRATATSGSGGQMARDTSSR